MGRARTADASRQGKPSVPILKFLCTYCVGVERASAEALDGARISSADLVQRSGLGAAFQFLITTTFSRRTAPVLVGSSRSNIAVVQATQIGTAKRNGDGKTR